MALQEQFRPSNSDWVIRARFDELKHTRKVRDYMRAFQVLDLECSKLKKIEKLYFFMCNLQPWVADELRRQ